MIATATHHVLFVVPYGHFESVHFPTINSCTLPLAAFFLVLWNKTPLPN